MSVEINYLAIFLAALSSLFVGAAWYSPLLFIKHWTRLARIDTKKSSGQSVLLPIATSFVVTLVTAYVLAHVTFLANSFFHNSFFQDAVSTAFWMWLGFVATRVITHDGFEGRPNALTIITISNELVTFLLMGCIIGLFGI